MKRFSTHGGSAIRVDLPKPAKDDRRVPCNPVLTPDGVPASGRSKSECPARSRSVPEAVIDRQARRSHQADARRARSQRILRVDHVYEEVLSESADLVEDRHRQAHPGSNQPKNGLEHKAVLRVERRLLDVATSPDHPRPRPLLGDRVYQKLRVALRRKAVLIPQRHNVDPAIPQGPDSNV
jgi:hypothetical protein